MLLGLGFAAGVLGGLLGIGGGVLIVPGLVFFLGFEQHRAQGTSLAAALLLSVTGVLTYSSHGHVDLRLAIEIAAGGVIGAVVGARVVSRIRSRTLRRLFSLFIFALAVAMIANGRAIETAAVRPDAVGPLLGSLIAVGTGFVTGFISALLGIGGGVVMVPAMVVLLDVPQHTAQGVSLAAIIPTALTAMLMHAAMGNVEFRVGKWVGVGGAIGALIGATVAASLATHHLRVAFGIFLIVLALLMALRKNSRAAAASP